MTKVTARLRKQRMAELVAEACGLVNAAEGVRSVHIVGQGRPTGDEARRFARAAHASHAGISIDRAGVVTIRPESDKDGYHDADW